MIASIATLGMYVATVIASLPPFVDWKWIEKFSIFSAYDPVEAIMKAENLAFNAGILLAIGSVGLVLGYLVFLRRDLPAGSCELSALVLQSCEAIQTAVTDLRDMKSTAGIRDRCELAMAPLQSELLAALHRIQERRVKRLDLAHRGVGGRIGRIHPHRLQTDQDCKDSKYQSQHSQHFLRDHRGCILAASQSRQDHCDDGIRIQPRALIHPLRRILLDEAVGQC